MNIQIVAIRSDDGSVQENTVSASEAIFLGRSETSPLKLEGDTLSRNHFSLHARAGKVFVKDLSSNGTWLNGSRLRRKTEAEVNENDLIEIPGFQITVHVVTTPKAEESPNTDRQTALVTQDIRTGKSIWGRIQEVLSPAELIVLLIVLISLIAVAVYLTR